MRAARELIDEAGNEAGCDLFFGGVNLQNDLGSRRKKQFFSLFGAHNVDIICACFQNFSQMAKLFALFINDLKPNYLMMLELALFELGHIGHFNVELIVAQVLNVFKGGQLFEGK